MLMRVVCAAVVLYALYETTEIESNIEIEQVRRVYR